MLSRPLNGIPERTNGTPTFPLRALRRHIWT